MPRAKKSEILACVDVSSTAVSCIVKHSMSRARGDANRNWLVELWNRVTADYSDEVHSWFLEDS